MTVNYYIKCPICGTVTRMRTPAGYIYKQPVHIHCGNCNTLLTGEFICDNERVRACFMPINCEAVARTAEYEYDGQTSGELLSHKIAYVPEDMRNGMPLTFSPAMEVAFQLGQENMRKYIGYATKLEKVQANWAKERILFDLFFDAKFDLIIKNYATEAEKTGYTLHSEYDILRYVHYRWFNLVSGIFKPSTLNDRLRTINSEFYHLDKNAVKKFCHDYCQSNNLLSIQKRLFKIFDDFLNICLYIMPAISTRYYLQDYSEDEHKGLSTCTFDDIKNFYLNSFETLADLSVIVKALDNIKYRGDYDNFSEDLNFNSLLRLTNGKKIKTLNKEEFFSQNFNLADSSNRLRNAIGHNDYDYNGFTQTIKYHSDKAHPEREETASLLSVAINCIEQMESAMILSFLLFELIRIERYEDLETKPLHPMFYFRIHGDNHCPCGSGKKYKKCCREYIQNNAKAFKNLDIL